MAQHAWVDGMRWIGTAAEDDGVLTYPAVELEPTDEGGENFVVRVGNDVMVDMEDNMETGENCLGRVVKLFEDEGVKKFKIRWFYAIADTNIMVEGKLPIDPTIGRRDGLEGRRLWLADDNEQYIQEQLVGCINRVVKVQHVNPGDPAPGLDECDYWYNQTHTMHHYTFRDCYVDGSTHPTHPNGREIAAIDLFSGCGGMSFVGQTYGNVKIKSKHAVDINHDALLSFKANNPDVNIHEMGVEEFLYLCKHANQLYKKHVDSPNEIEEEEVEEKSGTRKRWRRTASRGRAKGRRMSAGRPDTPERKKGVDDVVQILGVHLRHSVKKVVKGQEQGQLAEEITMKNSWLEFDCQLSTGRKKLQAPYLETNCPQLFKEYVHSMRDTIPRPGDIGLIMGGPPCQGVSGFNRHAKRSSILNCLRNAQVKAFYRTIEFFDPAYALMENVLDIFKKEDGAYAKFATAQLLALGFQSRMGVIAAGDHGCPQTRFRCFLWGAKSGQEILPPFPEPTFDGTSRRSPIPELAKCCHVTFLNEKSRQKAWPSTVNGDILSDLPAVSNFSFSEALQYKSQPLTPFQAWLRRDPPAEQLSRQGRSANADKYMGGVTTEVREAILGCCKEKHTDDENKIVVSEWGRCRKAERKHDFASEIWKIAKEKMPLEEVQFNKRRMRIHFGGEILAEMKKAMSSAGPLRDHRPRMCNLDDLTRIMAVPRGEGRGYRSMAGVVVNDDETTCAGHSHAFKGYCCKGGGVAEQIKRCTGKEGRVDHAERDGWRGLSIKNCESRTVFLPSFDLLCPRWAITTKDGRNKGRSQCFGRIELAGAQPTVVTRAEPHNIQICHHNQERVLTIRENARCQGFPDYYALVGTGHLKKTLSRIDWIDNRYVQIGNAVSPQVAMALGRGLALAASGEACPASPVVRLPDPAMNAVIAEAQANGLAFFNEDPAGKENICAMNSRGADAKLSDKGGQGEGEGESDSGSESGDDLGSEGELDEEEKRGTESKSVIEMGDGDLGESESGESESEVEAEVVDMT